MSRNCHVLCDAEKHGPKGFKSAAFVSSSRHEKIGFPIELVRKGGDFYQLLIQISSGLL